ncbi:hypothetical protein M514_14445 [Trichuris suis]|uniref:Uncharacterized protein n=1 Tax=Trichuris suis TaxID=68888 RepID=A0A085NUF9_9BILA|nr:hypothetical protein M514_14445 [Trichuris suis]
MENRIPENVELSNECCFPSSISFVVSHYHNLRVLRGCDRYDIKQCAQQRQWKIERRRLD